MYKITLNSEGGPLDTKTAQTPEQAAQMAMDMILNMGVLYRGDTITVESDDDEDE